MFACLHSPNAHIAFRVNRNVAGMASLLMKAEFKFTRRNGAALLMYEPRTSVLEGVDRLLSASQYEHLRDMHLVTEVVTCPAYALYLAGSSKLSTVSFHINILYSDQVYVHEDGQKVKLTLRAGLPVAGAVGATAGGEIGAGWITEGISGVFRSGFQPDQNFTTLYSLYCIRKKEHKKRDLVPPDPATLGKD